MIHEQIAVVVSWPVADLQYFAFLINQATVLLTPDELSGICHNRPLGFLLWSSRALIFIAIVN